MGQFLATVCEDVFGDVITMTFEENCLVFKKGNEVLAKWCEFKNLVYALDGYELINTVLKPDQILEVYNNDGEIECPDTDPATIGKGDVTGRKPDELIDKIYARGVFIFIKYPLTNAAGSEIPDEDNSCELTISNFTIDETDPEATYESSELTLPVYTFFSLLTNPTKNDVTKITNYLKIKNTTVNNITISGVIIYGGGNNVTQTC